MRKSFLRQIKCVNCFRGKKVHRIAIWSPSQKGMCCFCNIITILWWHNHSSLMHKLQTFGIIKDFSDHQKLSILSRNFLDNPENIQIIGNLSRQSRNFPGYLETFQIIRKLSRLTRNFPDHTDTFNRLSRNHPENIKTIRKPLQPSWKYPHHLETFWTILKISRLSGNFPGYPEIC